MNDNEAQSEVHNRSDIESLTRANAKQTRKLAYMLALFDRLPLGLYHMTLRGQVVLTNAAARRLMSRLEEPRLPILLPLPDDDGPANDVYEELIARNDGADAPQTGESREGEVQTTDGTRIHLRETIHVIRNDSGAPQVLEATIEDITDRHRAEAALRASEERYRSIVEHSPAGILLVDDQARIIFSNHEMSRILQTEPNDIIGHLFTEFLHPDSRETVVRNYRDRQQGRKVPTRYETQVLRADGGARDIVLSATTYQNSAGQVRTAAQILDVTDRTKAEHALRNYTEALEVRNAELDAFADSAAHDLKNPLSTIIGFAETLQEQLDTLSDTEISRVLRMISSMGRKMDRQIDELLIFSRIRRTAVKPTPVDMHPIVENALERMQRAIAEAGVKIRQPPSWPQALGHGPWLEEVWANYISNAINYGGSPPEVELGADVLPGKVRFWVRDNGDGIPPQEQARIFDGVTKRALSKGHGLGLSIVKRIVEKLGGEVAVASTGNPGEGSTFSFTLPAAFVANDVGHP